MGFLCCLAPATKESNHECWPSQEPQSCHKIPLAPKTPPHAHVKHANAAESGRGCSEIATATPAQGMLRTAAGDVSSSLSTSVDKHGGQGSPGSVTQPNREPVESSVGVKTPDAKKEVQGGHRQGGVVEALGSVPSPVMTPVYLLGRSQASLAGSDGSRRSRALSFDADDSSSGSESASDCEENMVSTTMEPVSLERLRLNLTSIALDSSTAPSPKDEEAAHEDAGPFREIKNTVHLQDARAMQQGQGKADLGKAFKVPPNIQPKVLEVEAVHIVKAMAKEVDEFSAAPITHDRFFTPRPWAIDEPEQGLSAGEGGKQELAGICEEDAPLTGRAGQSGVEVFYTPRIQELAPSPVKPKKPAGYEAIAVENGASRGKPTAADGELYYTPRVDVSEQVARKPHGGMGALAAASQAYFSAKAEGPAPGKLQRRSPSASPLGPRRAPRMGGPPRPAGLTVSVMCDVELQENANHFSNPLFSPRVPLG